MKTVAEIVDMVEAYGIAQRFVHGDNHGMLADIERAIKERERTLLEIADMRPVMDSPINGKQA